VRITVAAPAKVNLRLRVGPPDGSGYHGVSTLLCTLKLADTVVVEEGDGSGPPALETAFEAPLTGPPDLGPPAANLAVRAAEAFAARAGVEGNPRIRLIKRIPAGAGLGGGSSDAAAVLRALHRLHPGRLDGPDLLQLAADLGSDVPFFVLGTPLARGEGRGERVTALAPLPARPVVVALPPFPIATAAAYRWLDEHRDGTAGRDPTEGEPLLAGTQAPGADRGPTSWESVNERAGNDFEAPVFQRHPELAAVRDDLREGGARPALLAGSGSTVFGVFEETAAAREAALALRERRPDHRILVTATRSR
jgi:4-diphosphocytidyl-2-C-methyl-D-erythritol kinase